MDKLFAKYTLIVSIMLSIGYTPLVQAKDIVQVEVIVFKHKWPMSLIEETWPDVDVIDFSDHTIDINNYLRNSLQKLIHQAALDPIEEQTTNTETGNASTGITYEKLPKRRYSMVREEQLLRWKKGYSPVLHIAWLQDLDNKTARPVHIYNNHKVHGGKREIDGIIDVKRYSYIKFKAHFQFNADPIDPNDATVPEEIDMNNLAAINELLTSKTFELLETISIKENVVQYIDHPLYGLLVKVKPFHI